MYVKTNNGVVEKFPYSIGDLRKENPQTSFPQILGKELLESYGVFAVTQQPQPETDRFSYAVVRHLPEFIEGKWQLLWDVKQKSAEQIAEDGQRKKEDVRNDRDSRLSACDWTQLDDTPITNAKKLEWATYRQALRDLPNQPGFPWDVTWPVKP